MVSVNPSSGDRILISTDGIVLALVTACLSEDAASDCIDDVYTSLEGTTDEVSCHRFGQIIQIVERAGGYPVTRKAMT